MTQCPMQTRNRLHRSCLPPTTVINDRTLCIYYIQFFQKIQHQYLTENNIDSSNYKRVYRTTTNNNKTSTFLVTNILANIFFQILVIHLCSFMTFILLSRKKKYFPGSIKITLSWCIGSLLEQPCPRLSIHWTRCDAALTMVSTKDSTPSKDPEGVH